VPASRSRRRRPCRLRDRVDVVRTGFVDHGLDDDPAGPPGCAGARAWYRAAFDGRHDEDRTAAVTALLAAGGAFLLAVIWMDLMFDVQALRSPRGAPLPDAALGSIAAYYRRVTTDARPMNQLVAAVMTVTVLGSLQQVASGDGAFTWRLVALLLCVVPIVLATGRVFPNAARLGTGREPRVVEEALAREIAVAHVWCFAAMLAFVAIQLGRAS